MKKSISYRLLYGVVYAFSLLPFRALYALADVVYWLVYYVVRYRRRLVRSNLTSSFPQKSEAEVRDIEKQFYHWLSDYMVETIKLLHITGEQLLQHIEFRNVEEMERYFSEGRNCAAILGHYCNWEWLSATGLAFKNYPQAAMGLIYHPLRNHAFDSLFIDLRSAHGGVCVPKKDILRFLRDFKREDRRSLFGYISDQVPWWTNIHLWLPFLNHETPVFTGAERIMRKMNDAVFYVDMERPCRGKYICTFKLITDEPQSLPEFEITRRFFQMLEQRICSQPAYYLWTHNRWKRTREEFDRRLQVVDGKLTWREAEK